MPTIRRLSTLPAVLGGTPAVTLDHAAANRWPVFGTEEEQALQRILRDGNISTHPVIRELEADYAALTGRRHALAHNNGTAALLAAFFALGLKPGDEVIVPSATFWASVVPMLWLGAIPIFCESEPERLGPDPEDIERKITPRTKAIVVVHLWGMPCKMTQIQALAQRHNLRIIEDASHAHGARWRGQPCGALGAISVFSLQGDKLAPAGEGGILLCDEDAYIEQATCLGDITRIIELETPARRFAATSFGIKTRIAPLSAALGRVQLRHLQARNAQRQANLVYLSRGLENTGFHTFLPPAHIERTYFEFIIRKAKNALPPNTDWLIDALRREGCQVSAPRYPLLHQQPLFTEGHWRQIARVPREFELPNYSEVRLPNIERLNATLLKLPSFPHPCQPLLDQYAQAFEKVVHHAEAIASRYAAEAAP
jgi:perosamine synthetase